MTADSTNSKRSLLRAPFVGPNGIRAGWRLLMFLAFCIGIIGAFLFAIHHIPALHAWRSALPENEMSAAWVMFADGFEFAAVFVAALLMSRIEKRTFADYYLPLNQAFGMRFWQGVAYGLAMVSLFMAAIAAFRGFSIGELALTGGVALKFGASTQSDSPCQACLRKFRFAATCRQHLVPESDSGQRPSFFLFFLEQYTPTIWGKRGTARSGPVSLVCCRLSLSAVRVTSGSLSVCMRRMVGPKLIFFRFPTADF